MNRGNFIVDTTNTVASRCIFATNKKLQVPRVKLWLILLPFFLVANSGGSPCFVVVFKHK
ncbi:hypothetical protein Hanom_Chr15g01407211 [Helianthus anomalus]